MTTDPSASSAPRWRQFIHRFHKLGMVEMTYANELAIWRETARYPVHVPSRTKNSSEALNRSVRFNFDRWKSAGIFRPSLQDSMDTRIDFASGSGEIFHELRVLESRHGDCIDCWLRVFAGLIEMPAPRCDVPSVAKGKSVSGKVLRVLEQAFSAHRSGAPVKIEMVTVGGILSRKVRGAGWSLSGSDLRVETEDSGAMTLRADAVCEVESVGLGFSMTHLFRGNGPNPCVFVSYPV